MAKKKPTAKQLAARKKFTAIMKSGGFKKKKAKSVKKSRSKTTKTVRKVRKRLTTKSNTRKPMARRRMSRRMRSSGKKIGGIFKSGLIGKAVTGIGAATITGLVMNQFAPQFSGIASPVAGFAAGGPIGGIAALLVSPSGLGGLTNILMPASSTSSSGVMSV